MEKIFDTIRHFFSKMFSSSSVDENYINQLFTWFLILAAVIIILVFGAIIIGAIRYHYSKHPSEPNQSSGNKWIEITWTVIPFLILVFFFYFTVKYMKEIDTPSNTGRKADIKIIGHQWWWEMQYPEFNFTTANELHIPSNTRLLVQIESADVIHDWWVPDLGRKMDAIPGQSNFIWINANKTGEYQGTCSEYCGTQHAHMRILVISESAPDYRNWVGLQQKIPSAPTDEPGMAGARLFKDKTCITCHSIRGVSSDNHVGPDLTYLGQRKTLLSFMIPNTPQNLTKWLQNPQKMKEGAHMPDFKLTPEEISALVTYLEGLK